MSSSSPLRVAMVGCGGITQAHLAAFEQHPDKLKLVAACDPAELGRETVSTRMSPLGEVKMFESAEAMIPAVKDEADAALITTPHFLHYPQARLCVDHGLP